MGPEETALSCACGTLVPQHMEAIQCISAWCHAERAGGPCIILCEHLQALHLCMLRCLFLFEPDASGLKHQTAWRRSAVSASQAYTTLGTTSP
jgi:hypothetical protein